ncbi:sce7726 family protein [Murimonas intestini]|uniref:Sce7726 family protein n=1 Tax=Murimonas intestini TaxID=1337051 RepID=A0AB73T2A3_9FIRM|nr:sce7726 family protein [Murimonas intestini]MCR1867373.1 sce7726 family protein [Murimonas intestini]MCR1884560.1 sce7726 family protein [Murimonas intestini]
MLYDRDIREPVFDYLEERFGKTRVFEEKTIGKSRADILLLTEKQIIGLEIKSDADTYERLKRQIRDYNKFCDANYIIIGKSHEKHVEEHIPKEWGILTVQARDKNVCIEEKRPAQENLKMKKEQQISLMWRPELQHLLEINHLPVYRQKSKKFVQQKLLEKLDWENLKIQMCEELFERDYTLWDVEVFGRKRKSLKFQTSSGTLKKKG